MHQVPQLINRTHASVAEQRKWEEQVADGGREVALDQLCRALWILFCVKVFTPENISTLNCTDIWFSQYFGNLE